MKLFILLLSFFALLFVGCSSSESARRGRLSDAMEASSDDHKGEREVDAEFREPEEEPDRGMVSCTTYETHDTTSGNYQGPLIAENQSLESEDTSEESNELKVNEFSIGAFAGSGVLSSNDFYGITSFGLNAGLHIDEYVAESYFSYSHSPVQQTSKLARSLDKGIALLEVGVQVRIPTTPGFTFIGHYFLAGFGVNMMLWDYKNSFKAPRYEENGAITGYDDIASDGLNGINLFVGMGIDLTQTLPVHFIAEIIPGVILWNDSTREGFDNDIFSPFTYIQFRLKFNLGSI